MAWPDDHGRELDGETVAIRCEDGLIAELGPGVEPADGDEVIDGRGLALCAAARQRPHPRGDDPVPRLRRRPAADGVAGELDLAGRGEARARGRLLGDAPGGRGDDPLGHDAVLRHVLARRARSRGRPGRRAAGRGQLGADRRARPAKRARGCAESARRRSTAAEFGPLVTPSLGPHAIYTVSRESLAWIAEVAAEREIPLNIHLSETEGEVRRLRRGPREAAGPLPRRARLARVRAPCSRTASGSTTRSSS